MPVPDRTECPRCHKIGFVRHEKVIRGDDTERHYYCGACNCSWRVAANTEYATDYRRPPRRRVSEE